MLLPLLFQVVIVVVDVVGALDVTLGNIVVVKCHSQIAVKALGT